MKHARSIQNRLVLSVFISVFAFAAFVLIYYEKQLHQLSITKSSQILDLVGSRYHEKISDFLMTCQKRVVDMEFKSNDLADGSILKKLDEVTTETECFQESGIYFQNSEKWLSSEKSSISKDQIKNMLRKPGFSFWWEAKKTYLVSRNVDLEQDARLILMMNLGYIRSQLRDYQHALKSFGFIDSVVCIKNSKTFQGFGINEYYYKKIQGRNSEVNFEFDTGDFISMHSLPFPKGIGQGFLCSIIPAYDVFRPIYSTGIMTIFSVIILLFLSMLLVVYVVQLTINPLKQAIIQIEKSTTDIGQVSDQNLNVGKELSQMVHQQSDVIGQLSNQVEVSIHLGNSNSQQINESKDVLMNTIDSIRFSFSSLENVNNQLNLLQNLSDEIKIEIGSLSEISNRIDIVAINASIEAARAGVRGRDFAVVADEIAKLANSSLGRSSKIVEYLNSLIKILEATVYASNQNHKNMGVSVKKVDKATQALELVASQTNQQITHLNTLVKVLNSSDRQTVKNRQLAKHCAELGVLLNRSIDDLTEVSQLITTLINK